MTTVSFQSYEFNDLWRVPALILLVEIGIGQQGAFGGRDNCDPAAGRSPVLV